MHRLSFIYLLFIIYYLYTPQSLRAEEQQTTFPIVYDFAQAADVSGKYSTQLMGGARLTTFAGHTLLDLGQGDGYADLGADFGAAVRSISGDYTISVTLHVPSQTSLAANGNFIWCMSRSSTNGYLFLSAKDTRFAITKKSWSNETSVGANEPLPRGEWVTLTYVQSGATGTLYVGTEAKAQQTVTLHPADLNQLRNNYLGRSPYDGDVLLRGARYADFRVYDEAINAAELQRLADIAQSLNHLPSDVAIAMDAEELTLPSSINNLYEGVTLPLMGSYGSAIAWRSSDAGLLSNDGQVVGEPAQTRTHVTLTATITNGSEQRQKQFDVYVHKKDSPYSHYLFTFFPSNSDENIYYALSDNGYDYTTINNAQPVVLAKQRTVMGGLRDPHILRGQDGRFYMVATDMKCSLGWESNRGMVLMRSDDMIHWQSSTVHFPQRYAGTYLAKVIRVWAPETIWDAEVGKYMIYFSILTNDGTVTYDKVFYAYANDEFTDLEGEPVYLYDRGSATIDMNIVYNDNDHLYHAFYKNEGSGGICKVTASSLTAPSGTEGTQWSQPSGTLQQTSEAVEGAGVFRLINSDDWILMYDCYMNGHYQFCSSPDLTNFTARQNTATSGSFTPRHGTVIPITEDEYQRLKTMDFTDGIDNHMVNPQSSIFNGQCFDLSGRRVSVTQRGVYVVGGKVKIVQ